MKWALSARIHFKSLFLQHISKNVYPCGFSKEDRSNENINMSRKRIKVYQSQKLTRAKTDLHANMFLLYLTLIVSI